MSQSYADLAHERDELLSENATLRSIMDKMLEKGKRLEEENRIAKINDEHIRQTCVTHDAVKMLIAEERAKAFEELAGKIAEDISAKEKTFGSIIEYDMDDIKQVIKEIKESDNK